MSGFISTADAPIDVLCSSSAYSLSGYVSVRYTPSTSFGLARQPPQDLFLTSLELTFEGQSELIINGLGYVPLRTVTVSKELISSKKPVQITSGEQNAEWQIVFNLAIPGWLPPTCLFGNEEEKHPAGVTYGLSARARFLSANDIEDPFSNSPGTGVWGNLCSVVRRNSHKPRFVNAEHVPIRIKRYISPPADIEESESSESIFPTSTFAVQATPDRSTNLPADILRSIQLHAIIPSRVSMDDTSVPLTIRLRCRYEDQRVRNNLKVYSLETDVVQVEKYQYVVNCPHGCLFLIFNLFSTSPPLSYTSRFPLPLEQPPNVPLRAPHNHLGNLFDMGLVATPPAGKLIPRERSLVPSAASRTFKARGPDGEPHGASFEDGWVRMDVDIPVVPDTGETKEGLKRVTTDSPLFEVSHQMRIRVTVGYEHSRGTLMDDLAFVIPLEFVNVLPKPSSYLPVAAQIHSYSRRSTTSPIPIPLPLTMVGQTTRGVRSRTPQSRSSASSSRASTPLLAALPAYNQLYTDTGHRRHELSENLPVYSEKESPSFVVARGPSSSTSSLDSCPSLRNSPASTPESPRSFDAAIPRAARTNPSPNDVTNPSKSRRPKYRERLPRLEDDSDAYHPRRNGARRPLSDLPENDIQYGVAL